MQKFKDFLTEAVNYDDMFASVWKSNPEIKGQYDDYIKGEINWARKTLKKQDRIIWFLQWIRSAIVFEWGSDAAKLADYAKFKKANPESDQQDMKAEVFSFMKRKIAETHTELEHFFSMNVPNIEKYKFINYVSYENQIYGSLKTAEDEWSDGHEASIPYNKQPLEHHDPNGDSNSGISIVKQFTHDYYWVNLKKYSCRLEGDAMGHCGNTAAGIQGENIISFRKLIKRGADEKFWLWEPHMTFILDAKGFVGEMKGRANKKPEEKYHKYIIALLEDPIIKGIKGGGYAPEENFSLNDLTPEQKDKLYEKKPALMDIMAYFKKHGRTPELIEKINVAWAEIVGQLIWDDSFDHATVWKFKDIHDFTEDYGDDTAKWCSSSMQGDEGFDTDYTGDSSIEEVLEMLDETKVEAYLAETYPDEWKEDDGDSKLITFIKDNDDDLYSAIRAAAGDGERMGAENEMTDDFKSALKDIDVMDDGEYNDIASAYIDKESIWDEPLFVSMTFKNILNVVTDEDAVNGIKFKFKVQQPHYGWNGWDADAAKEYMKQEYEHLF